MGDRGGLPLRRTGNPVRQIFGWFFRFAALLPLTGYYCVGNPVASPPGPVAVVEWDTTFSVDRIVFPDSGAVRRSVLLDGNHARLAAFFKKMLSGKEVNVGFFGGSITAGARASSQDNYFSNRLARFLGNMFLHSHIAVRNAGIGATTTRFGCSRIREDLLDGKPDLVILEFAENDKPWDTFTTAAAMEGIVRQCLRKADLPVIIFNTVGSNGNGVNQDQYKKIGDRYHTPMVSYQNAIWPLVESGKIQWSSIGADDIHPNDTGHLLCAYLLYRYLKNAYRTMGAGEAAPAEGLPDCRVTDLYENAGMYHGADTVIRELSNGWQKEVKEFKRVGYTSQAAGDSIQFETGVAEMTVGFYYGRNVNSKIRIAVNDEVVDTVSNYWTDGLESGYMATYRIFCAPSAIRRTVVITHLDDNPFFIDYVLYASRSTCFSMQEGSIVNMLNY